MANDSPDGLTTWQQMRKLGWEPETDDDGEWETVTYGPCRPIRLMGNVVFPTRIERCDGCSWSDQPHFHGVMS